MGSLSRGTKADQFSYVPAGTVLPFAGDTAPSGWAICNGDPVSRTDYAELFTAIGELWGVGDGSTTFNLPDMRGQFLRGLDTTEGVDPDFATRAVGSSQEDKMQGHKHEEDSNWRSWNMYTGTGGNMLYNQLSGSAGPGNVVGVPKSDGVNGTPRTGPETRPKNVAVNYIIKL
jgi:microcystin-dependent protein